MKDLLTKGQIIGRGAYKHTWQEVLDEVVKCDRNRRKNRNAELL